MIKNSILLAVILLCSIAATAQDAIVLHMKDGTTRRFPNGQRETTHIRFYDYVPTDIEKPRWDYTISTKHDNGYSTEWDVNSVWHIENQYAVGMFWKDDFPQIFQLRHGLCFGTKPNLSFDNCEQKAYSTDAQIKENNYSTATYSFSSSYPSCHYMVIGQKMTGDMRMDVKRNGGAYAQFFLADTLNNRINTYLEPGQTYYYRTFAEGQVAGKAEVFYGKEHSFTVPRVMADFGYYPYVKGTDEAVAAFNAHYPEGVVVTWDDLERFWNLWRASDEGKQIDLTADIATETFDDGTGYRLNRIPDEFYTWITQREVVIDAFDGLTDIKKIPVTNFQTAIPDSIDNVDAKWNVPGGKYIRFRPALNSLNIDVTYSSNEVAPGVRYKLILNFAPETEYDINDPEMANQFLSTIVNVYANDTKIVNSELIPATELTTIVIDDFNPMGTSLNLKYETRVSAGQVRSGTYNRTMRIAEARLIPQKE